MCSPCFPAPMGVCGGCCAQLGPVQDLSSKTVKSAASCVGSGGGHEVTRPSQHPQCPAHCARACMDWWTALRADPGLPVAPGTSSLQGRRGQRAAGVEGGPAPWPPSRGCRIPGVWQVRGRGLVGPLSPPLPPDCSRHRPLSHSSGTLWTDDSVLWGPCSASCFCTPVRGHSGPHRPLRVTLAPCVSGAPGHRLPSASAAGRPACPHGTPARLTAVAARGGVSRQEPQQIWAHLLRQRWGFCVCLISVGFCVIGSKRDPDIFILHCLYHLTGHNQPQKTDLRPAISYRAENIALSHFSHLFCSMPRQAPFQRLKTTRQSPAAP